MLTKGYLLLGLMHTLLIRRAHKLLKTEQENYLGLMEYWNAEDRHSVSDSRRNFS